MIPISNIEKLEVCIYLLLLIISLPILYAGIVGIIDLICKYLGN